MNRPNTAAEFLRLNTRYLTVRQWNGLPAVARATKHLARKFVLRAMQHRGTWFRVVLQQVALQQR